MKAYSGYYRDERLLKESSSGGAASAIAESVLKLGGVVFGVAYSKDYKNAEYVMVQTVEELFRIKGTKYISANKKMIYNGKEELVYSVVEKQLMDNRNVLFIGLGCTVGALYTYLKNRNVDIENLYTIDLICHGSTPVIVHEQFIESLQKKYKSPINDFTIRYKEKGWTPPYIMAKFENGKTHIEPFVGSDYGIAFDIYLNNFCYKCAFKGENHKADITLGDYWGLTEFMDGYNKNGVSILLVKTDKGEKLINQIAKDKFSCRITESSYALEHNKYYCICKEPSMAWEQFDYDIKAKGLKVACCNYIGAKRYYIKKLHLGRFLPKNFIALINKNK